MEHFAYTDGACSGNPGPGGWAVLYDNQLISGWEKQTTNNVMELYAVLQAVMACPAGDEITIYTDSKLVIGWLAKRWKCHHEHLRAVVLAYFTTVNAKGLTVRFEKVKGHSDNPFNIVVDREAVIQVKILKDLENKQKAGGY